MTQIVNISIRGNDAAYSLELDWDDEFLMEGKIHVDLVATRKPDVGETTSVTASVAVHTEHDRPPQLVIFVAGEEVFRENLSDLTGENAILDAIPGVLFGGGDPIIGCFIRAGISATVSQLIKCRNQSSGLGWTIERLVMIGRCLKESGVQMGARLLWRAGRCIAAG